MSIERRKHPRFKKTCPVIIHRPYNERRTETTDISIGGAAIYNAQHYYEIGQRVYLEIALGTEPAIRCDAKVVAVYPRTKEADTYRVSLQFVGMKEEDKQRLQVAIERAPRL